MGREIVSIREVSCAIVGLQEGGIEPRTQLRSAHGRVSCCIYVIVGLLHSCGSLLEVASSMEMLFFTHLASVFLLTPGSSAMLA